MAQRVKDPALPLQQQLRSLLRHGFDHWPRNIHMPWVPPPLWTYFEKLGVVWADF